MARENDDQKDFWERFAETWVTNQADLDALMEPVLQGVLARAELAAGDRVLDIGCGTGTSTQRAAQIVGPKGHVTGADISEPMLVQARRAANGVENVAFVTADVADHPFEPGSYDKVISRFGVMFFEDPVKAFVNVRRAMKPGASLAMACWSVLEGNPWFRVPMLAAKARLGAPPPVDPDAPGPLAFRDPDRVRGILIDAGFGNVEANVEAMHLTPPGDLAQVARHAASIGPAARTMEHFEGSEADFDAIAAQVTEDFAPYAGAEGVLVPAEINIFAARAPA